MIKVILLLITVVMPDGQARTQVLRGDPTTTMEQCVTIDAPKMEARFKVLMKTAIHVNARCITISKPTGPQANLKE